MTGGGWALESHGPLIAVLQGGTAAGGAAVGAPGPVLGSRLDLPTQNLVKFLFSGETFKWVRYRCITWDG